MRHFPVLILLLHVVSRDLKIFLRTSTAFCGSTIKYTMSLLPFIIMPPFNPAYKVTSM
jgi:hypothetical protein